VEVVAGEVGGLIPERWVAEPLVASGARHGFVASPRPDPFRGVIARPVLTAAWVDATEVGLPSDLYYLVATGPVLGDLFAGPRCRITGEHVYVDRAPASLAGDASSPGDFVASGRGTCVTPFGVRHRWAYFVAAPGFGPVRQMGIDRSGLYVAAAVTRASPYASGRLRHLMHNVTFGGDPIREMVHAVDVA
jgi:hypothetical protein